MPTKRPAQKDCRFKRVRCLPTAFRCHSPLAETSARPVSEEQLSHTDYTIQRASKRPHFGLGGTSNSVRIGDRNVRNGSWLCENAKTLNRDRRSYSSKTVLVAQRASGFNLEIELKNIILRRVSIFEFLHSQGHSRHFGRRPTSSSLPLETDIVRAVRHVSKVPEAVINRSLATKGPAAGHGLDILFERDQGAYPTRQM
jgi:hypothetical protein